MQRTSNYGLCQYEGSDKTSYLVNYNDDMLKIDTAIKSAADGASAAQTKADTADGKADTNAGNISTLNTQINGEGGIAADLGTVQGNVQTISSLIGNGSPTTSNQTIIGAINGIEGAIAPREDADTLANSYSIGDQFARGGSVYEALTSLTAGTAFASLVLNTNYKAADSLVEQIADVSADLAETEEMLDDVAIIKSLNSREAVSVENDDTWQDLTDRVLSSLNALIAGIGDNQRLEVNSISFTGIGTLKPQNPAYYQNTDTVSDMQLSGIIAGGSQVVTVALRLYSTFRGAEQRIAYADGAITMDTLTPATLVSALSVSGVLITYKLYNITGQV